jgi:hypothetical protein
MDGQRRKRSRGKPLVANMESSNPSDAPRPTHLLGASSSRRGTVPRLDPSDPRHGHHPSNEEQWLEFAREIGRMMAMVGGDMSLFNPEARLGERGPSRRRRLFRLRSRAGSSKTGIGKSRDFAITPEIREIGICCPQCRVGLVHIPRPIANDLVACPNCAAGGPRELVLENGADLLPHFMRLNYLQKLLQRTGYFCKKPDQSNEQRLIRVAD